MDYRQHARATVTLFACTISGGLVSLPATYQSTGLVPAFMLTLVAGGANALSLLALARISQHTGLSSYGAVAARLFGPTASALVDATVGIFLVGVLSATFIVVRDWYSSILGDELAHVRAAVAATAVGVVFPLALPRSIGLMAYTSLLSISAFGLLVAILIAYGSSELASGADGAIAHLWLPAEPDTLGFGHAFNVLIYTFGCQFQLMAIYTDRASTPRPPPLHATPVHPTAITTPRHRHLTSAARHSCPTTPTLIPTPLLRELAA
jgi:amino acid permease